MFVQPCNIKPLQNLFFLFSHRPSQIEKYRDSPRHVLAGKRGQSALKLVSYAMVHDLLEYIDIRSRR